MTGLEICSECSVELAQKISELDERQKWIEGKIGELFNRYKGSNFAHEPRKWSGDDRVQYEQFKQQIDDLQTLKGMYYSTSGESGVK